MKQVNLEFLERYQKLWDSDQSSRVFAPLAEAYRKNGNLHQALQICKQGLNLHPNFAGGWLQIAKIYTDREEILKAIGALIKAVTLAPENILAHNLLGELYLKEKNSKEALKAFKMVLLLNPNDSRARKIVERLESLTADEYSSEVFQIENTKEFELIDGEIVEDLNHDPDDEKTKGLENKNSKSTIQIVKEKEKQKSITQTLTLIDALLVRNEFLKAKSIATRAIRKWGPSEELESLLGIIEQQQDKSFEDQSPEIIQPLPPRPERIRQRKIKKLEGMLLKIIN